MLITDKNEIIRLKLLHGHIHGKLIEFAETYAVLGDYSVQINTFVLIQGKGIDWAIRHVEQNGESLENEWGGYGGGNTGQEKYIKGRWREIVYKARPNWQETRCKELKDIKNLMQTSA